MILRNMLVLSYIICLFLLSACTVIVLGCRLTVV